MHCSPERLINALVAVQARKFEHELKQQPDARPLVVTLSRSYGALGRETGQLLADELELRLCDRSILQAVAERAHTDIELVKALDEHVSKAGNHWWRALSGSRDMTQVEYFQHLARVVLSISHTGGVILGRGAHMILGPKRAFRVRITGSLTRCAERIAQREQISLQDAEQQVIEVNRERSEYLHTLYGMDIDDPVMYELTLNSDSYSVQQMVQIILYAMIRAGYSLKQELTGKVLSAS